MKNQFKKSDFTIDKSQMVAKKSKLPKRIPEEIWIEGVRFWLHFTINQPLTGKAYTYINGNHFLKSTQTAFFW
jgi:hypothetical protein